MGELKELEKVIEDFYRARGYEVKVTLERKEDKEKRDGEHV